MTFPTGPSILRQEIKFMKACRRGDTPHAQLIQQFSEKVQEIVMATRERREGVVSELKALAKEFAAIDPGLAVDPILEDLTVSLQKLKESENQLNPSYEAKESQRNTMEACEATLLSQVKQLSEKLAKTPTRHNAAGIIERVGSRVCNYQINPDSARIQNVPSRFPTHKF